MKKTSLVFLVLFTTATSFAQDIDLGLQYSLQFFGAESRSYEPVDKSEIFLTESAGIMSTFKTGLVVQYSRIRNLGIESSILLDFVGWKFAAENSLTLGKYRGRTLNFGFKIPVLAYYKIPMKSGGSYFFGGGMNFNLLFAGSYKYRDEQKFYRYDPIVNYESYFERFTTGYQVVVGIEDSEHSQIRFSYGKYMTALTSAQTNELYPYYFNLTLIQSLN